LRIRMAVGDNALGDGVVAVVFEDPESIKKRPKAG